MVRFEHSSETVCDFLFAVLDLRLLLARWSGGDLQEAHPRRVSVCVFGLGSGLESLPGGEALFHLGLVPSVQEGGLTGVSEP